MPLTYVSGDPLLTQAQTLAFGHNAQGRVELGVLETCLQDRCPAAFATYRKQCHSGRIKSGGLWLWRETYPHLAFLTIRESSVGATRLRYVESVLMTIARDYRLYGLESLALAPLGDHQEWPAFRPLLDDWLSACPLPIRVYEQYRPGVAGE